MAKKSRTTKRPAKQSVSPPGPIYLVQAWEWLTGYDGDPIPKTDPPPQGAKVYPFDRGKLWLPVLTRAEGCRPVRAFTNAAKAAAFCSAREQAARRDKNPFRCGALLSQLTNLDGPRLHDWLLDAGLEPPVPAKNKKSVSVREWRVWWDQNAPHMTELQKSKVWEALNKVRFFEVEELEPPAG